MKFPFFLNVYVHKFLGNGFVFALLCVVMLGAIGCVPENLRSRGNDNLKNEVAQLHSQYMELEQNQIELRAEVNSLSKSLSSLELDLENKFSALGSSKTSQELETVVDAGKNDHDSGDTAVSKLGTSKTSQESETAVEAGKNDHDSGGPVVSKSSLYQSAYSDYSVGKYDLAYSGFRSFLDKYPNDIFSAGAQFYIGECLYSRCLWDEAIKEYEKVENYCGKSHCLVVSAILKIGLCYEKLGRNVDAVSSFSFILENFPESPESLMARERIKMYKNAQTV